MYDFYKRSYIFVFKLENEVEMNNYKKLSEIFWEVAEVEHYTEKYTVRVDSTDKNGNNIQ